MDGGVVSECPSFLCWSFSGGGRGGPADATPHSLPRILIPAVFITTRVPWAPCSVPGTCEALSEHMGVTHVNSSPNPVLFPRPGSSGTSDLCPPGTLLEAHIQQLPTWAMQRDRVPLPGPGGH